jgi:hypothetical protein
MWTSTDPLWPEESPYAYVNGLSVSSIDVMDEFPIACAATCAGATVCPIDLWATCYSWKEEGFSDFFDCAGKTFENLPCWLKFGCQLGLEGCITCLFSQLMKLIPVKPGVPRPGNPGPGKPGTPGPGSGPIGGGKPGVPRPGRPGPGNAGPGKPSNSPGKRPGNTDCQKGSPRPGKPGFPKGRQYRNCRSYSLGCQAANPYFNRENRRPSVHWGWKGDQWNKMCNECYQKCKNGGLTALLVPPCSFWDSFGGYRG